MAKRANPKKARTTVRMYRQGLGDCFLLTFPGKGSKPFHLVIDCGVCKGAAGAKERMAEVVEDIHQRTGGVVDALVITHEHFDHLSGFQLAREAWEQVDIRELWMAWTEKAGDKMADQVRDELGKKKKAVSMALAGLPLSAALRLDDTRRTTLEGLLGLSDIPLPGLAAAGGETLDAVYTRLKKAVKTHEYLMPHTVHTHARLPGVRFFVLGPPKNIEKIKHSDPLKRDGDVVYEDHRRSFAFSGASAVDMEANRGPFPADVGEVLLPDKPGAARRTYEQLFREHFSIPGERDEDEEWRKLGDANLMTVEGLALALANDTNNISLALAIQLPDGRVLLFPGDAQVGNCLSWHDADFQAGKKKVSTTQLLNDTVLYKVSHHASHNGTMTGLGLEQMIHKDLMALVPLEVAQASLLGYSRTMPWKPMIKRLQERTRGRIVYSDTTKRLPTDAALSALTAAERKAFAANVESTDLYIDVSL